MSDTELYMSMPVRQTRHTGSRGGGFKNYRPQLAEEEQPYSLIPASFTMKKKETKDEEVFVSNGKQFFCPKRFNRYPRFTIFFKKDQDNHKAYMQENTVSLNPQFLSFLMDNQESKKTEEQAPIVDETELVNESQNLDILPVNVATPEK